MLYLRRYREYERRLAIGLRRIAAARLPPAESAAVATVFTALFPQARAGQDRQALAAALALQRALLLVTGGLGLARQRRLRACYCCVSPRRGNRGRRRYVLRWPRRRAVRPSEWLKVCVRRQGMCPRRGGCGVVCRVAVGSEYGASFAWGDPRYAALSSL